jgi:hypothetical protein
MANDRRKVMTTENGARQGEQSRYERMMTLVAHGRKLHSRAVFESVGWVIARLRRALHVRVASPLENDGLSLAARIHSKA